MKSMRAIFDKLLLLWRDRRQNSRYWAWMLDYAKPYIPRILLNLALNMLLTAITVGMALISKQIIDSATRDGTHSVGMLALYLGCMLFNLALGAAQSLLMVMLSERFSFGIRKQLYERLVHAHWMEVQKYHTGDLMTRLTSDAGSVAEGLTTVVPEIIRLVFELIIVFFTLFHFSRLIALLALMLAPVAAVASFLLGHIIKKLQIKVQESEAAYRSFLQESLANLLIIKSFANEDDVSRRLVHLRDERFYWVLKKSKLSVAASATMSTTFQVGYIAAFSYGALQISRDIITYGTMSVFLTLVNRVQAPILQLATNIPKMVSILASAGRIMELQDLPTEERLDTHFTPRNVGVSVSGLTFGYTPVPVLEDVTLDIRPGEFVAVVGESGVGKTTLVRLLMAFTSSLQGRIAYYNDQGEREPANAKIRDFVSYVPQGNTLFSGTIRENICMGKLDATEDEIAQALRFAAAYDFVMQLPQGVDTVIGERGHGLSEGQAQRIAIARALVKQAPVLILDEATSALDEATELAVLGSVRGLSPRPTCLLITHRRSVLQYCDREIRIADHRIQTACLTRPDHGGAYDQSQRHHSGVQYGAVFGKMPGEPARADARGD